MCEECKKYIREDGECRCSLEDRDAWRFVHSGEFDEVIPFCETCGKVIV